MRQRSALWIATHPLPWWVVTLPAAIVFVATLVPYLGVGGWLYVAPGRLSSLAHESVFISGAVAAMAGAWAADRFVNRHGLGGAPSNGRPLWRQSGSILVTIVGWWVAAQLMASTIACLYWMMRATGGRVFVADIAIAAAGLTFFTMSGFAIGLMTARWFSPLLALAWAGIVDFVVPVAISSLLPWANTNLEFFLYPAMGQQDHRALNPTVMGYVGAWWFVLLAALTACVLLWPRDRTGASVASFAGATAFLAIVGAGVAYLPHMLPTPFLDGEPEPIACRNIRNDLKVCVTETQARGLDALVAEISPVVTRMGNAWPDQIQTIASGEATRTLMHEGLAESDIAWASISSFGVENAKGGLAASLGGTHVCQAVGGSPIWGYAFADWLAPGPYSLPADDPTMSTFIGKPDAQILDWYQDNHEALLTCSYEGPGPQ